MEPEPGRSRTAVACEECRRKKRKCDGLRPTCTLCQSLSIPCIFSGEVETRKRKKWSDDYVAGLEIQLATWKAYARELEVSHSLPSLPDVIENFDGISAKNPSSRIAHEDKEIVSHQSSTAIDEIGAMVWRMNVGDSGEPSFAGPSSYFSLSEASSPASYRRDLLPLAVAGSRTAFTEFSQNLGVKQLLAELFMTYVNPLHLFLQPQTKLSVEEYPHSDLDLQLLHTAVFAAGLRYVTADGAVEIADELMSHAETIALHCCRTSPSVLAIQALNILCWRELVEHHDSMAWLYNSMGGGLTISLGLHAIGLKNLSGPTIASNPLEHNLRIRTFWSFFFMDRIIASLLGRHCTIPWPRVDTPSLGSILAVDADLEEIALDNQCQLWFLHDKYMEQIYAFNSSELEFSKRDKLLLEARQSLLTFYRNIDSRLQFQKSGMPKSAIFLQMSFQMSTILLHRPYLREPAGSSSFHLALCSMTVSAAIISRLILAFRKIDTLNHAPPFLIHHILTAAIVHLLNTTDSRTDQRVRASNKLKVCLEALEALQSNWPRASKAILLLQELAKRWAVVSALPMRFSNPLDNPSKDLNSNVAETANWNEEASNISWNDENDPFGYVNTDSNYSYSSSDYADDFNIPQGFLDDLNNTNTENGFFAGFDELFSQQF